MALLSAECSGCSFFAMFHACLACMQVSCTQAGCTACSCHGWFVWEGDTLMFRLRVGQCMCRGGTPAGFAMPQVDGQGRQLARTSVGTWTIQVSVRACMLACVLHSRQAVPHQHTIPSKGRVHRRACRNAWAEHNCGEVKVAAAGSWVICVYKGASGVFVQLHAVCRDMFSFSPSTAHNQPCEGFDCANCAVSTRG
jgi:hypothetical protein